MTSTIPVLAVSLALLLIAVGTGVALANEPRPGRGGGQVVRDAAGVAHIRWVQTPPVREPAAERHPPVGISPRPLG